MSSGLELLHLPLGDTKLAVVAGVIELLLDEVLAHPPLDAANTLLARTIDETVTVIENGTVTATTMIAAVREAQSIETEIGTGT